MNNDPQDTADARRQNGAAFKAGDRTADYIAKLVMLSFLCVAGLVLAGCGAIVGYFSANAQQVVGYYFGSSTGSAAKQEQIASHVNQLFAALSNKAETSQVVVRRSADGTTDARASGAEAANLVAAGSDVAMAPEAIDPDPVLAEENAPDALQSKGYRNKNPGNILCESSKNSGILWRGCVEVDAGHYCVFSDHVYGIRAIIIILSTYYHQYKIRTVDDIIERYAPQSENPTASYRENVCAWTGFRKGDALDLNNWNTMRALVCAIIRQECSHLTYSDATIAKALSLAGMTPS